VDSRGPRKEKEKGLTQSRTVLKKALEEKGLPLFLRGNLFALSIGKGIFPTSCGRGEKEAACPWHAEQEAVRGKIRRLT